MPESAIAEAPAAAPTPAPSTPPPAPAQRQPTSEPLNDAFADLDDMMKEPEPSKPDPKKAAADAAPKKSEAPKKTEEPPKPEDRPIEKMAPKQLREAYEALKAKHAQLETEHETFKKTASQPKDDPEKKELQERAERMAKRAQEYEQELKFTKYEKSEEYQDKYWKPYVNAFGTGRAEAAAIKITDAEGNVRQGTPEDFDAYMGINDPEAAADFAERVFGKHKTTMEYYRNKVRELGQASQLAIDEYRKKGSEREKELAENQSKAQKAASQFWETLNKTALEKYPALFKADDTDPKGKELLTKGFNLAERAFSDGKPMKEGDKPLNAAELLQLRSAMRNKFAAFDYQVYLRRKAEGRIKELEAEVEQYKKSEPGAGDGGGERTEGEHSWEADLDSISTPA